MCDSEDYPLMTVGELARALGVPREFVFIHAGELGAICLRLRDANGRASAKFERGGPLRFRRAHVSLCSNLRTRPVLRLAVTSSTDS